MRIHPAADIFPMVPDDGLQSLAESIRANGLRFPIVVRKVDDEDEIIDGRNRLRACEIAGVEPAFTTFEGDDDAVLAFITDANIQRRDLKKTQKAAIFAKMYPEPARLKRKGVVAGNNNNDVVTNNNIDVAVNNFDRFQLSKCRAVGAYSPDLLNDIIHDRVPLETAFKEAKDAEARTLAESKTQEARRADHEAKMGRLRDVASDLADLVVDERMSLDEAMAALQERERKRQITIQHGRQAVGDLKGVIVHAACIAAAFQAGERVLSREDFEEIHAAFQRLKQLVEAQ